MNPYHKILTVWQRDPATNMKTLVHGAWHVPEFEFLANNRWAFTEKVDGTNVRVQIVPGDNVRFGGKTDDAQMPATLLNRLRDRFVPQAERLGEMFPDGACLYGEGYGARIQKGGGNYRQDQDFVLFDVLVGQWWLERSNVQDVAAKLGLDVVPVIGGGSLWEMIEKAARGFDSAWGDFTAEGIVARPAVELQTRAGHRIITKIKHRDFA